jgi:hypothetical protein
VPRRPRPRVPLTIGARDAVISDPITSPSGSTPEGQETDDDEPTWEPMALSLGARLGSYEILSLLGAGPSTWREVVR